MDKTESLRLEENGWRRMWQGIFAFAAVWWLFNTTDLQQLYFIVDDPTEQQRIMWRSLPPLIFVTLVFLFQINRGISALYLMIGVLMLQFAIWIVFRVFAEHPFVALMAGLAHSLCGSEFIDKGFYRWNTRKLMPPKNG